MEGKVYSYLNAITGQKEGDLEGAPPLADVIANVKAALGPDVILVGQSIKSDIAWLTLEQGVDYKRKVRRRPSRRVSARRAAPRPHCGVSSFTQCGGGQCDRPGGATGRPG